MPSSVFGWTYKRMEVGGHILYSVWMRVTWRRGEHRAIIGGGVIPNKNEGMASFPPYFTLTSNQTHNRVHIRYREHMFFTPMSIQIMIYHKF